MDINTQFIANYSQLYVASRLESARQYHYGNGSAAASMIATVAAGVRKAAATIERWARGTETNVVEHRLPRMNSAR